MLEKADIKTPPIITVFMPAYNAGKYIKESISSILNQTYTHFELLIINDGSTDNTLEIISGFNDQRIRVINNAQNMGLLYTRNLALIEVNTEFIAIMDSDDVAMPERLAIQLKELSDNSNIALIGSQASMIDENGKIIQEKMYPVIDEELLKVSIPFYNSFVHSSVMIRSNILRDLGGYKEDYAEDYDLFLRAATQYRIKNLPDILIHYRNHVSGISKEQVNQMDGNIEKIKATYLSLLQLSFEKKHQKMLTPPFIWDNIKIDEYKDFYIQLFNRITDSNKRSLSVQKFIFEKWYDVIMKNGGKETLILFFTKPFFNWRYSTVKQLRRAFKNSIKNILKKQK